LAREIPATGAAPAAARAREVALQHVVRLPGALRPARRQRGLGPVLHRQVAGPRAGRPHRQGPVLPRGRAPAVRLADPSRARAHGLAGGRRHAGRPGGSDRASTSLRRGDGRMKRDDAPATLAVQPITRDVLREKYLKPGETDAEDLFVRVARALA